MKNVTVKFKIVLKLFYANFSAGLVIFKAHPQSINDFTGQIEAFLMNKNQTTLTLATIGQFEQVIIKEQQKVTTNAICTKTD